MDAASSKLLLWLLSFTRERESSSSEEENNEKSLSGPLQDNSTQIRTVEFHSKCDSPSLLLLYWPEGPDLLMPSLK